MKNTATTNTLPDFNDPRVKLVYDLLCEHDVTDKPKGDHWEGWVARRIVATLASAAQPAAPASEAPEGWRNKFAEAVYADLEAADNQDVSLEEYPARILKVLDSIVGPRHPTVIHWRNDAIQACIAIAYKYCRDPESFQYLKQDLQALIFVAPKAAPAPASVAHQGVVAWPVMPPSKGQSPILFEDGYAEGWAKCLEACRAALATAPTTQAAKHPVVNVWQQAIDHELVTAHLGVAGPATLEEARKAVRELILWNIDVAATLVTAAPAPIGEDTIAELQVKVRKLERDNYKRACDEWMEKTEWVKWTTQLGMHRADAMRDRIARAIVARPVDQESALDSERLDWLAAQTRDSCTGISFHWGDHVEDGQVLESGYRFMMRAFLGARHEDFRAAIDAARGEQGGSK